MTDQALGTDSAMHSGAIVQSQPVTQMASRHRASHDHTSESVARRLLARGTALLAVFMNGIRVNVPFVKTDVTFRAAQTWASSDNGSGLELDLQGGATQAVRRARLQTQDFAGTTTGILDLQPLGGSVTIGGATVVDLLPWRIEIFPASALTSSTNWATRTLDVAAFLSFRRDSSGAVNATMQFPLVLAAGTWNFNLIHTTANDGGIYTFDLDGTSIGTIDGYTVATTQNTVSAIIGVTVATTGKKALNLTMATKNGASASFVGRVQQIVMLRTA